MSRALLALLVGSAISTSLIEAQWPAQGAGATTPANLAQLMRGTLYPESNVVFAAQDVNPEDVPHAKDPSMATDPLASSYGKWQAVENNALAIAEVANLLTLAGRKCANGLDVPVKNPDWAKFVQGLREAGMTAYAAAQTKNQDKMTDAADVMTTACKSCHDRYRERKPADRCK
jgi:Cytochrome C'